MAAAFEHCTDSGKSLPTITSMSFRAHLVKQCVMCWVQAHSSQIVSKVIYMAPVFSIQFVQTFSVLRPTSPTSPTSPLFSGTSGDVATDDHGKMPFALRLARWQGIEEVTDRPIPSPNIKSPPGRSRGVNIGRGTFLCQSKTRFLSKIKFTNPGCRSWNILGYKC